MVIINQSCEDALTEIIRDKKSVTRIKRLALLRIVFSF
jgi:hypothetical protein